MSTSLLYQRFGVVGYHYVRQAFAAGATFFRIEQPRERLRCSACGSAAVWGQGGVEAARFVHAPPIGKQPTSPGTPRCPASMGDCGATSGQNQLRHARSTTPVRSHAMPWNCRNA